MAQIIWQDSFSVGIPQLDDQHKKLVAMFNDLHERLKDGTSHEVIVKILYNLVQYTKTHFADEEKIMSHFNYPKLDSHRKIHEVMTSMVGHYVGQYKSGEPDIEIELLKFLYNWFTKHIAQDDAEYGKFIAKKMKQTAKA